MNRLLVILLLSCSFSSIGQLKQKMADEHFRLMEYALCSDMYDELAQKCINGHKKGDWENVRKAAQTHMHLYEFDEASTYYKNLLKTNKLTEQDRVDYIQALRYLERYDEATNLILESKNLFPQNPFFKRLHERADDFKELITENPRYEITPTHISSQYGDFSPTYYNDEIVYATKSKNAEFIGGKYAWDNAYFVSLLSTSYGSDSLLGNGDLLKDKFLTKAHDGPVDFSEDGTQMVITKNRLAKVKGKEVVVLAIYFSSKIGDKWTTLEPFEHNNDNYNFGQAVFNDDASAIYFTSDQPGGHGGTDIYVSRRTGSSWSKPENLGASINTEQDEMFPYVIGNKLYFSSNGHYGLGGLDIFETKLGTSHVKNLGSPMNSSKDDFGVLTKDNMHGFISSSRKDLIDGIYAFIKKPIKIDLEVQLFEVYDSKIEVPEHAISVVNELTGETKTIMSDGTGKIALEANVGDKFSFTSEKQYFELVSPANVDLSKIDTDTLIKRELLLNPTTIMINLRVVEKGTGKILPNAVASVTDYVTGMDTSLVTDENGMVSLRVDRNKSYWSHGAKEGYIDADVAFNTSDKTGQTIDLELALPPIKKGEKFKLENIFYDLNKATLRPESMAALDKLADFILKNNLTIELSAHTDSRGSNSYNQRLSQARAQSCVDYLKSKGVKTSQMRAKGYGESRLVNKCKNGVQCSEEEHQENRRTEVKILEVN